MADWLPDFANPLFEVVDLALDSPLSFVAFVSALGAAIAILFAVA